MEAFEFAPVDFRGDDAGVVTAAGVSADATGGGGWCAASRISRRMTALDGSHMMSSVGVKRANTKATRCHEASNACANEDDGKCSDDDEEEEESESEEAEARR